MAKKRKNSDVPPALPPRLSKPNRSNSQNNGQRCKNSSLNDVFTDQNTSRRPSIQSRMSTNQHHIPESLPEGTASDLREKPRNELVLMLLQLNHEKANLLRWKDYFNEQIARLSVSAETDPKAKKKIDTLRVELKDVEGQLKRCTPIITFLNNKIRLNDVYAGDGPVYEKPSRSLARRKSIEFLHREEEREVARALQHEMRQDTKALSQTYGIITSADMLESRCQPTTEFDHTLRLLDYPEDAVLRERRLQLEAQLEQLDELWQEACEYTPSPTPPTPKTMSSTSRRQKSTVSKRVASHRQDTSDAIRPQSACDLSDLAYLPRRSKSGLHGLDPISSRSADVEHKPRSQSQVTLSRLGASGPCDHSTKRSLSSAALNPPSDNQKQRHTSESSKAFPIQDAVARASTFLMQPTRVVKSRWRLSPDWEEGSTSTSLLSSPPPPLPPPPPIPAKATSRKSIDSSRATSQMSRWRSFGDNLMNVDPELEPQTRERKMSEKTNKFARKAKRPESCAGQSMKRDREADPTPVLSEDPYEETPFVDSQYLTPRALVSSGAQSSLTSTSVNRRNPEEQPLPRASITAAVDYTPGGTTYDTTDDTITQTYPPRLTERPINLRALPLPRPVYPSDKHQNGNQKKLLTLPTSVFSAFRVPEKSTRRYRTQSTAV
ncbi:hypothetical protein TcWFU_006296 [Taenia crassiceps]|uniref:Uncharacterized protein n=1 Tax=Taenia crassiceps TaxID=6207 RepID=A0ABR4QLJ8_9CEST